MYPIVSRNWVAVAVIRRAKPGIQAVWSLIMAPSTTANKKS